MEKMNSMDLYNMNDKAKTSRPSSDAYLLLDSADRSSSTSTGGSALPIPVSQPYNDFRLQKPENLLQGGFTRLSLTEVRFPYAIPNINFRNGSFWVVVRTSTQDVKYQLVLPYLPGSTDGSTLASYVRAALQASPVGTSLGVTWNCSYVLDARLYGGFRIGFLTSVGPGGLDFALYPVEPTLRPYPLKPIVTTNSFVKSLLDPMGFNPVSNWDYLTNLDNTIPAVLLTKESLFAPMTYTTYIDIVSSKLTYYQNVKDGTTKAGSRDNIICRLYITDETSTTPTEGRYWNSQSNTEVVYPVNPPAGNSPFLIHRQFKSPKQFMWDKNTAVDWIDIQLFDDFGQPLFIPFEALPDFQITFKATED